MKLVMELDAGSVVTDMYNLLLPSQTCHTESERVGACILLRLHCISIGVTSRMYEA
jgi:hypothetical protein